MSFSPLWGAGGAYLNDIELLICPIDSVVQIADGD